MLGAPVPDQGQGGVKLGLRVMGEGQHNVPADVLEPGPAGLRKGGPGLGGIVGPAQGPELGVAGRLDPQGKPVDPGGPETPQQVLGDRFGVGLQGDFRPGRGAAAWIRRAAWAGVRRLGVPPPK